MNVVEVRSSAVLTEVGNLHKKAWGVLVHLPRGISPSFLQGMALCNARCRALRGYINIRSDNGITVTAGSWSVLIVYSHELTPSAMPA